MPEHDEGSTTKNQPRVQVPSRYAGRALDALVAEKVMGYTWFIRAGDSPSTLPGTRELLRIGEWPHTPRLYAPAAGHEPIGESAYVPAYSTDIAAAWLVVEKLREMGWANVSVSNFHAPEWGCTLWREPDSDYDEWADAPTAPLAICLAALQAMEAR